MASELRRIDPYGHLITTSHGGSQTAPLWEQSLMEVVQPHCYQTASIDFASSIRKPRLGLAQYGKPVLPGEGAARVEGGRLALGLPPIATDLAVSISVPARR